MSEYICSVCGKEIEQVDYGGLYLKWFKNKPVRYTIGKKRVCESCYLKQKKRKRRVYILNPELDIASEPQIIEEDDIPMKERYD